MDACSMIGESTDAIVMDDSLTNEKGTREASQSAIPAVSLCPPDGVCAAEAHLTDTQSEEDLGDSCSSLGHPSSSFQLYHQVPQGPSSLDYPSCQPRRCHCCGHNQTAKPSGDSGRDSHPAAAPHADCSAGGGGRGCGSAHQAPCSSAVRCHWLHGSHDGGPRKPMQRHVVTVRNGGLYWIPRCYSHVVVDHPLAVLVGCAIVLLGCSMAGLLIGPLPDFSDPLLGFEPRGTYIGVRQSCLTTLYENTGPGKALSLVPQPLRESNEGGFSGDFSSQEVSRQRPRRMPNRVSSQDTFLCDAPGERYAQLVFRSGNSASLWSLKAIYSMCEIEQARIRSQAQFQDLCLPHARAEGEERVPGGFCCPSWSLGNYLAVLSNASSCLGLTSQQVSESLSLLRYCAPYYHHGYLVEACVEIPKHGRCGSVPSRCKQSHVVFLILHFLVDKDFLSPQTVEYQVPSLKYSLLFLPVEKGDHMMDIYLNSLEDRDLTLSNTTITGMDLGIKQTLFKYYLARDSVYPILAIVSLVFTMALYLKSLFVSVIALIAIITSLLSSYFFYKVVLRLTFFPLLNLSAALIVLGSCCNQVFTFVDFWNLQLSQNPSVSLDKRVNRAMQEVGYLILASGLTSSVAFLSGYISSITAIRCFSVYLGTASLISSLLTLVWLPCSLILRERYTVSSAASAAIQGWKPCCSKNSGGFWDTSSRKRCLFTLGQKLRGLKRGVTDTSNLLFLKILPCGVVKFRYIWMCWFAVLAAGGTYISCIDPGMKLPTLDNRVTQLFRSSHPFERYDAEYRHMFMFERQMNGEDKPVTITLVWGVNPLDNGNHLNPKSNGSLVLDTDFNMSSPNAQVWLRDLCGRVQNLSFYFPLSEDKSLITDNVCLVEQLIHWVSARRCSETVDAFNFCCNNIPFPYPSRVFEQCLSMMLAERQAEGHLASSGGPYFEEDGRIAALVLAFKTTYRYSFNFSRTSIFYKEILTWFNREIAEAPSGLDRGWFIGQFSLFDLQQCLSSETLLVAGSSIALTFVSLFLTTWNILLSIYGTVAVGGSVFVTVGLLVLLEWELSGIEALFISAAAGLSVDFIANYCVSYSSAPHSDRIGRVAHSTKRMGCPVAIGSSMFFFIGIIMLPATALLFRKLGIFLFLVKCVACGFATFFFQSLCCFFGPQKNVGKIMLPCSSEPSGDNVLSSCTTAEPNSSAASAANGAFGRCRVRRNYDKDASGYLYPNNHRQQRQKQHGAAGVGGARVAEQYELQPLAYRLSDSFENSTCTSKLSNRPSVLSDEIEYCGRDVERNSTEADSEEMCGCQDKACHPPPALQTSSPYRENTLRPVAQLQEDLAKDRLLCKTCRDQSSRGVEQWRSTSSTSSTLEETVISQTLETIDQLSLDKERQDTGRTLQQVHKRLHSFQSQSSGEYLEDSSETRLSDTEPRPSNTQHAKDDDSLCQPGHLNGKRDTLRLSLKETVYETSLPGSGKGRTSQSEEVVILPNSKPDLPDVWIKRDGQREDTF